MGNGDSCFDLLRRGMERGTDGGLVGEWTAQRQQAVQEATPRILQRLRPKYGRMYNFDDAQPVNIALLAASMQASLTNR